MIRHGRTLHCRLCAAVLAGLLVVAIGFPASAQVQISRPYLAVFGGQRQGDFRRYELGLEQRTSFDWRPLYAVEAGFEIFGLTVSPGFITVNRVEWTSEDGNETFYLKYRAIYLNLGAREDIGLYFAGGLNYTFWDELPQSVYADYTLRADGEIGFQAALGFIFSIDVLPLHFLLEAGYGQYNGNAKSVAGVPPTFNQVSSTGPMVRFGIGIGR